MTLDYGQLAADQWSARRHRDGVLGPHFAGEAGWDMLLHLRASADIDRRIFVSAATSAAGVPPTTALRALDTICRQGLVRRLPDGSDRRRYFLELTLYGRQAVEKALAPPRRVSSPGVLFQKNDGGLYLATRDSAKPARASGAIAQIADAATLMRQALALLGEVGS